MNIENGRVYWTINTTSRNRDENNTPVTPWCGKLKIDSNKSLLLHRFDKITGETFDGMANFCCCGGTESPRGMFDSLDEAREEYVAESLAHIKMVCAGISEFADGVKRYLEREQAQ